MPTFDLASLTKPLVTATLAHERLDLDIDRRGQLGLEAWPLPMTVRQLLSHSAGLPPWLPFTGEALADQLARGFPAGAHPLLREGQQGEAVYSDLGYRLLAELLERETGQDWRSLGAQRTGLQPSPWAEAPTPVPDGPDAEAWRLAEPGLPLPPQAPGLPHDANARAGMKGHAGFGATPDQMRTWLQEWTTSGLPARMAVDTAQGRDGSNWGLGLQRCFSGPGRFGQLLSGLPATLAGVHVVASTETQATEAAPALEAQPGAPTDFWMHFGYTGPALFVRPATGLGLVLLLTRRGPAGELLDIEALRARRWQWLRNWLAEVSD